MERKELMDALSNKGRVVLDDDAVYAKYLEYAKDSTWKSLADEMSTKGRVVLDNDSVYNDYLSMYKEQPNVEVPVEEGITGKDYATAIFPRSMKSIEEGRDVVAPVDIEKGELGSFLPFISNEQLASGIGDASSLVGRSASSLYGSVKRALSGDMTEDEQLKANLEDMGQIGSTDDQGIVSSVIEEIVRDPAMIPSALLGSPIVAAKVITSMPTLIRNTELMSKVVSKFPGIKKVIAGVTAGTADIALMDFMNDYAMDEDNINATSYGLGAVGGALIPGAIKGAEKLSKKLKGVDLKLSKNDPTVVPDIPETFGIGKDAMVTDWAEGTSEAAFNTVKPGKKGVSISDETMKGVKEGNKTIDQDDISGSISQLKKSHPGATATSIALEKVEDLVAKGVNKSGGVINEEIIPMLNNTMGMLNSLANATKTTSNYTVAPAGKGITKSLAKGLDIFGQTGAMRLPVDLEILRQNAIDEDIHNKAKMNYKEYVDPNIKQLLSVLSDWAN